MSATPYLMEGEDSDFLIALGRFMQRWAHAETSLELCNAAIYRLCGGEAIKRAVPLSLEGSIEFFKQCHAKLAVLASFSENAKLISDEFTRLRNDRHFLVHGLASMQGEGAYDITKYKSLWALVDETLPFGEEPYVVDCSNKYNG